MLLAEIDGGSLHVHLLDPILLEVDLDVLSLLLPRDLLRPPASGADVDARLGADNDKLLGLLLLSAFRLRFRGVRLIRKIESLEKSALLAEGVKKFCATRSANRVAFEIQGPQHGGGGALGIDGLGEVLRARVVHGVEAEVQLAELPVPLQAVGQERGARGGQVVAADVQGRERRVGVEHGGQSVDASIGYAILADDELLQRPVLHHAARQPAAAGVAQLRAREPQRREGALHLQRALELLELLVVHRDDGTVAEIQLHAVVPEVVHREDSSRLHELAPLCHALVGLATEMEALDEAFPAPVHRAVHQEGIQVQDQLLALLDGLPAAHGRARQRGLGGRGRLLHGLRLLEERRLLRGRLRGAAALEALEEAPVVGPVVPRGVVVRQVRPRSRLAAAGTRGAAGLRLAVVPVVQALEERIEPGALGAGCRGRRLGVRLVVLEEAAVG
mmetsp:Transcript_126768/g.370532  ORF Transcript_126768/g.370532 Transcript_126768/m.370532 type:complete len:446 (-) Transcript_126768:406-1743(-)